ncbi:coiled-coil domain-containing protein 102A isoform X2 [Eupeodes corollae]|uniref:coiled-coil domain-containing protein 102A isoform X2 n=1 Tax=Eupeodes corollae TaxID=290404 RepID=UPI0024939D68|nr:coiled-coil domain-containing protein 102A isoform X2 [Eupeodes corollae]
MSQSGGGGVATSAPGGGGGVAAASLGASRRHRDLPQDGSVSGTSISARFGETEWEARESQRQRELEEARARAAQMEKTMKWWSDCTANWREKWSKVRNERNKAREEAKQLRANLDIAMKESNSYKREKNDLEMQITQLKKEMEKVHMLMMKHAGQFHKEGIDNSDEPERDGRDNNCSPDISSDGLKKVNSEDGLVTKAISNDIKDVDIEEYVLQGAVPKNLNELLEETAEEKRLIQQLSKDDFDEEYLLQKISMLQLRLDEAQKTIQVEREEKHMLHKNIEKVSVEIQEIRDKHEELRSAKQEAVRELLTLQEQHRAEVRILNNSIQEEVSARENLERRLCELRTELERLQAENASEWGKRERLETEKLALERDNKKLRSEIRDLQERSDRKGRPVLASDVEFRTLQQELSEKNKEIGEIKQSHSKLKKLLAETNTELGHAVRRAEQYEGEVKRLRARVEELKRELAGAEDELDAACNQVRRLQRSNDELIGQTEGLQVQIQHLQTRRSVSPQQRPTNFGSSSLTTASGIPIVSHKTSNLPLVECKPNINDLRQLFDDPPRHGGGAPTASGESSKRSSQTDRTLNLNQSFFDAKPTHVEENIFESKARNLDFERAKQKFDNPHHHHHQREQRERSSGRFANLKCSSSSSNASGNNKNSELMMSGSGSGSVGNGNGNTNVAVAAAELLNNRGGTGGGPTSMQLFDDHFRSSGFGGGGNVGVAVGVGGLSNSIGGGSSVVGVGNNKKDPFSRNSINLDGLKVSDDDETP